MKLLIVLGLFLCTSFASVDPVNCTKYNGPMQILKIAGEYDLRYLNFGEDGVNTYDLIYTLPENDCTAINACGVHPSDDVAYCACKGNGNNGNHRMIRFDEDTVEYLMGGLTYSWSGTFDDDGTFYYLANGDMYKIEGINGTSPTEEFMYSADLGQSFLPADLTTGMFDLIGDGIERRYAVGMENDNEVHVFPLATDCYGLDSCHYILYADGDIAGDNAMYGAAFAFDGKMYMSTNSGDGIYRLEATPIANQMLNFTMTRITTSEVTSKNDGLFCYNVRSVFAEPEDPTVSPTQMPVTSEPTPVPTERPSNSDPSVMPSVAPTQMPVTSEPTPVPTERPSISDPSVMPSVSPTQMPVSSEPTPVPTERPSKSDPSVMPTDMPVSSDPSVMPSSMPSESMPSVSPTTSVDPVDCSRYNGPLQILKIGQEYDFRFLNFGENGVNTYDLMYTLPNNDCIAINACGVHPHNDIAYCSCKRNGGHKMIRFDEDTLEYVMDVDRYSWTGSFDGEGNFYYIAGGDMYKIENINGASPTETNLYNTGLSQSLLPADIATVEMDFIGDGVMRTWAVGMENDNEIQVMPLAADCYGADCHYTVFATGDMARDNAMFGAAYQFNNQIYMSENSGSGIYRLTFTPQAGAVATAHMTRVTTSTETNKNDGLYCFNVTSVFQEDECTEELYTTLQADAKQRCGGDPVSVWGDLGTLGSAEACAMACEASSCSYVVYNEQNGKCTTMAACDEFVSTKKRFTSMEMTDNRCDIDCEGSWSACSDSCERAWQQTVVPMGAGAACPTSAPSCAFGEDSCPDCTPEAYTIVETSQRRCSGDPATSWNDLGTAVNAAECGDACIAANCNYAVFNVNKGTCTSFDDCSSTQLFSKTFTIILGSNSNQCPQ